MTLGLAIAGGLSLLLVIGAIMSVHGGWKLLRHGDSGDGFFGIMLIMLAVFLLVCLSGVLMLYDYESGPSFELLKAEWQCSASHVVKDDDGDVSICDQYSRNR